MAQIAHGKARGQHQNRGGVALAAQILQHRHAVAVRQAQIQNNGGEMRGGERAQAFGDAADGIHRQAFLGQAAGDQAGQPGIILNQQQPHKRILQGRERRRNKGLPRP